MVRDESDIIEYTLRHMLHYANHALILDNGSVDGTREILEDFGDQITVIDDPEVGYYQDIKMTNLTHKAGYMGADWIFPFDADECWTIPDELLEDTDVIQMRSHVFVPNMHDDHLEPNPLRRMRHRMTSMEPFPKVAFRYHPRAKLHMGNHGVDHPGRRVRQTMGMRHYQYRSLEQVKRKVRQGTQAYNATELPATYGAHWKELAALDDKQLEQWFYNYVTQETILTSELYL